MKILNCQIIVKKGIFKPREETIFWVKNLLKKLRKEKKSLKILDIFSGSGFIGITVLKNIRNSFVDFVDINQKAVQQIKENLRRNKIFSSRYRVFCSDMFEKLRERKYHFILANPPYVAKERLWQVQKSVIKTEPKNSWYGGKRGMFYIKKFLKEAKKHLEDGGEIVMECDPLQKKEIEKLIEKEGYNNFQFHLDQFGKTRWVEVKLQ